MRAQESRSGRVQLIMKEIRLMFKFDVFGRIYAVQRQGTEWHLFLESGTGKRVRDYDVAIPSELNESELEEYLDDMFHEHASETHPSVIRLE